MKHLFRLLLTALTLTAVLVSCGDDKQPDEIKDLVLTPSKTTVTADGADKVTFAVKYGETDVTASAEISVGGVKMTTAEFTATDAGEYKFKATYDGKTSNEVTVTATEAPAAALILSVDKNSIIADNTDKAVFTVMQDGVDVTANSSICMTGDLGVCLASHEFLTDTEGEYEFYASLKDDADTKSNTVKVTATAPPITGTLTIEVDKTLIGAAGEEAATFTVKLDEVDVTANAEIYKDGVKIESNEFKSDVEGDYEFDATYATLESENSVTVTVKEMFFPNIAMLRFSNNGCSPCTSYMKNFFTPRILPIIDGHYVEMTVHGDYPNKNDPNLYADFYQLGRALGLPWSGSYWVPEGNFDMKWVEDGLYADAVNGNQVDVEEMKRRFQDLVDNKVSDVGFNVVSSISGGTANIEVTVKSSKTDTYTLFVALLEDGIDGTQSGVSGRYTHDNTLRAVVTPGRAGESLGEIAEDATVTKTYTVDIKSGWNADNCKLFIFASHVVDGKTLVNNACHASINGTTPYRYR